MIKSRASTTHRVAEGHRISINGTVYAAGHELTAADVASATDPDGRRGLQRLIDGGEVIKSHESDADEDSWRDQKPSKPAHHGPKKGD